MATLIQNPASSKDRIKKHDLHIDFTPMVDLAFLLLTFFMLTTSLNVLNKLTISLPDENTNTGSPSPIKASQAFTVIMGEHNKVYYYAGEEVNKLTLTDFSKAGIEQVLKQKSIEVNPDLDSVSFYKSLYNNNKIPKEELENQVNHFANNNRNIFVFIKAADNAKYQNLVSNIDVLNNNNIRHYALDDINVEEKAKLKSRSISF